MASSSPFAPQYVHGVYIPSALLIVGTAIIKSEWLVYAVALAAILGSWKVYNNRKIPENLQVQKSPRLTLHSPAQSPQAERVPELRAQGEDDSLPQHRYVKHLPPKKQCSTN